FLVGEHARVEELFSEYEGLSVSSEPARRRWLVDQMIRELRVHTAMEEQSLYPSIREVLAEGNQMVNEALEEHAEAKELLAQLEITSPDDPSFSPAVETLISDVRHHVHEEEAELLPKLRQAVGESWLLELGEVL